MESSGAALKHSGGDIWMNMQVMRKGLACPMLSQLRRCQNAPNPPEQPFHNICLAPANPLTVMALTEAFNRAATDARIAQLKFKQALSRGGPNPANLATVPLEDSTQFCAHIDAVFEQDTPKNIQTCKQWILKNIVPSETRVVLLGEFLVSVSKAIVVDPAASSAKSLRNRLDILLVISDVLHTLKFHTEGGTSAPIHFAPYIEELVGLIGICLTTKDTQIERKLKGLIKYWHANAFLDPEHLNSIIEGASGLIRVAQGHPPAEVKEVVHTLPDWFGEQSASWHNAPTSYMLERTIKQPARVVPADSMRVNRFSKKHPTATVSGLLDEYFATVDLLKTPVSYEPVDDINEIGNISPDMRPDVLGRVVKEAQGSTATSTANNGYGWSGAFAEDIQANDLPERVLEVRENHAGKMDLDEPEDEHGHHGRYRHTPQFRRRRYSSSASEYQRKPYRGRNDSRSSSGSSYRSRDRSSSCDSQLPRPSRFTDDDDDDVRRPAPDPRSHDAAGPLYPSVNSEYLPAHDLPRGFPQTSHNQPYHPANFVPPPPTTNMAANSFPPPPPSFPALFPMPPYPPPFPLPTGVPMTGMPAPLPNIPFPPMGQIPNQPYGNFGNNVNYGNNTGYSAFNRGGFQGDGSNGRGSYRGSNQRGASSRWN
ncbi:hypothetical protein K491DRAFT_757034 [Lophiostoma macrostomum CBS 122681]|uniref:CID domain-containing protein n=1 Tax=Lophiostoma macrostomum CBS 122681 TaxID=1314788 RepID=A0A6A6TBG7_9PLEO|nr:hypothetical protein K491DRAFT_757034 [Lophiostoma macrostomum CBS 122681]